MEVCNNGIIAVLNTTSIQISITLSVCYKATNSAIRHQNEISNNMSLSDMFINI
jgi:hypothetical protein